jgi:lipopolysaccharide transport system permease protein
MTFADEQASPDEASVIEARRPSLVPPLSELWRFRELLAFFVWRDVKVRYKQTLLGVAWVVLQPLLTTLVLMVFIGRLAPGTPEGSPLAFYLAGILPWTFFAQAVTLTSSSLLASAPLLTKVYFPRILIPLGTTLASLFDTAVASLVLVPLAVFLGGWPGWALVGLPLGLLLAMTSALAVGTLMSALTIRYRDLRHVVPFLVQLGIFVTPVLYPVSALSVALGRRGFAPWLAGLNPMTGAVELCRWSLTTGPEFPGSLAVVSGLVAFALLTIAYVVFRVTEWTFADDV